MHDPNNPLPEIPLSQRETIDLDVTPEPKPSCWRRVIDRNPLFLISGVCMLGGCFLVSGAIHAYDPAEIGEKTLLLLLIALLAVLNVYEFAVIWLGLALARTQTLVRDTRHLLGLALLLLIDAAFVYNETSIFEPSIGGLIAVAAACLALFKAWWIARSLDIRFTPGACVAVGTVLFAMYVMPVLVRLMAHDGFLDQPYAMLVWCALGVAVAMYALPLRWFTLDPNDNADLTQLQKLVAGGLIALPLLSLIGHACALLWVYENEFALSMLSPILLGLAAMTLRQHDRLGGPVASAKAATIVVACAIIPCLLPADGLIIESAEYSWLAFSPLRGVLLASPLVLIWGWWLTGRGLISGTIAALPWCCAALGHTPSAMVAHGHWLFDAVKHLLPRTQLQWGALAIAIAFACLIAGGLISWWRASQAKPNTPKQSDGPLHV